MRPLDNIALRIIKEQELVIGPLAWSEARKVQGIKVVNAKNGDVRLENGDQMGIVDNLVAQYEKLFGRASHEVCKEAVADLVASFPKEDIPMSLRA